MLDQGVWGWRKAVKMLKTNIQAHQVINALQSCRLKFIYNDII